MPQLITLPGGELHGVSSAIEKDLHSIFVQLWERNEENFMNEVVFVF